jgi:CDP-diacylglycerol---serine O-phosphatidyltransferase
VCHSCGAFRHSGWHTDTELSCEIAAKALRLFPLRLAAYHHTMSADPLNDSLPEELPAKPHRGVYLFPNLLTTGTLFAGFYAIIAAIDGNFSRAGIGVFAAMFFDGLDGRVARWTNTQSEFGKEYDSLSDMVAFGLGPALIVYQWGVARIAEYGLLWGRMGWLAAFFYAVAAGLRLARFNTKTDTADKRYFEGLPSPSAAAAVTGFVWLANEHGLEGLTGLVLAFLTTIAIGALMVSRFPYWSGKDINLRGRIPWAYALVIPLMWIILSSPETLVSLFGLYAASAPLYWCWRRLRRRHREAV